MARLEKNGARKPRIPVGYAYVGCNYRDTNGISGRMPPMDYSLTVGVHGGPDYTAFLSEDEMLHTITEWLKLLERNRDQERKDEEKRRKLSA
jgi:hypothetical protein